MVAKFAELGVLEDYSRSMPDKPRWIKLLDGSVFKTMTITETVNIGKEAPQIIIVCEAAQTSMLAYNKLRLRAAAGKGYLLLAGTFERSAHWFADLWKKWRSGKGMFRSYPIPSWTNTHIYPLGRQDPEILAIEAEMDNDLFMERIAGIPVMPTGLVFSQEFDPDIHVADIEYIPGLPVTLAIDPGYNQSAHALLAIQQPPDSPIRVFDEIYGDHLTTYDVIDLAVAKPWWKDVTNHADESVIDIAGTKYQQTVDPPSIVWMEKTGLYLRAESVPIQAGIDRIRSLLKLIPPHYKPQIVFAPHCEGILSEFGMIASPITQRSQSYSWKYDSQDNKIGKTPQDKYNHSIKALTYWVIVKYGYALDEGSRVMEMKRW